MTVVHRVRQVGAGDPRAALQLEAGYGRLYATGPVARPLSRLPGGYMDSEKARRTGKVSVELPLTLDTLRAIKTHLNWTSANLARACSPQVLAWAKYAAEMDKQLIAMHQRLSGSWRLDLPWTDTSGLNRVPFDHQKVMATVACMTDGCAFLADTGTGKTRSALEALAYHVRMGNIEGAIVVCTKKAIHTWSAEGPIWAPELTMVPLRGSMKERQKIVSDARKTKKKGLVFVTNYQALDALNVPLSNLFRSGKWGMALDEMHKIKNPRAQQTQAAIGLARLAVRRIGMTASPILQGVADIWAQWYIVDLGITFGANFTSFRREYYEEQNVFQPGPSAPYEEKYPAIGQKMRKRGLRYRKGDCLDLPPHVYEVLTVEMSPKQARAYQSMQEQLVAELELAGAGDGWSEGATDSEGVRVRSTASTQLTALTRLSQITSGFMTDVETKENHAFDTNPKLDALEDIVEEAVQSQQIIVWCRYREDVKNIKERLKKHAGISVIIGGQSDAAEAEALRDFQTGVNRILVSTSAGSESLNLQVASLAIYYSQDYALGNREQSEGRNLREGSQAHQKITYMDLVCAGTVDEVILQALKAKKRVSEAVVDLRSHVGLSTGAGE